MTASSSRPRRRHRWLIVGLLLVVVLVMGWCYFTRYSQQLLGTWLHHGFSETIPGYLITYRADGTCTVEWLRTKGGRAGPSYERSSNRQEMTWKASFGFITFDDGGRELTHLRKVFDQLTGDWTGRKPYLQEASRIISIAQSELTLQSTDGTPEVLTRFLE